MAVHPIDSRADLKPNLTAIPGVVGVAVLRNFPFFATNHCCPGVYAIDPNSYFAVTKPESWYFVDGDAERARDILSTRDQVLISQTYQNMAFLEVGDVIALSATTVNPNNTVLVVQLNVTVGGVVRSLPGIGLSPFPAIFASLDTLAPFEGPSYFPSVVYLVDLAPEASWRSVKAAVIAKPNVGYVAI